MPNQATASDLSFYEIFVPQKVPLSQISDDIIAYDFWFAPPPPPPIKNPGFVYARGGAFWAVPFKSLLVSSKRELTFLLVKEDQQTFAPKQVTTNAFFL